MRIFRDLPLVALLLCSFSLPVSAADPPPSPEWDGVLDRIYNQTWRGRADLDAGLKKEEARIRQELPAYMAAWEQRLTMPIVYTDRSRGEACAPLAYCATDITDLGGLIRKLQEKKEPVSRFLFEKLSPGTQKAIAAGSLGSPAQKRGAPDETQVLSDRLLADELTRIVREDSVYSQERFAGVRLSYAAANLATGHNDADNRVCVNKTLLAEAFPAELARNFKCAIPKDETFRRMVAAATVHYLRTGDTKSLNRAILLGEKFEDKLSYTDFAFWYYYPRTLADVRAKNAVALKYDAYGLLNNAILGGDPLQPGAATPEELKRRQYGWNLADAVLIRGIVTEKIEGLETLGSAVWLLGNRNGSQGADAQEQELARLLTDVRRFLAGPDSDNYRLNYAVAMREGERRRALLVQALDAKQGGPAAERLFAEAREYLLLANGWAATGQGRATAAASYLELLNLALARMKDILPPPVYAGLAANPGRVNADTAAQLYRELADKENDGWERLRFLDRKGYVDGVQRLWNALRRNSLLAGAYYLGMMDPDDFQSVMDNAEPAERALLRYARLFEGYAAKGHREVVPDSAYFAYAETMKMLSRLKTAVSAYNASSDLHNQSVDYLVKAISVYPYDDGINRYVTVTRKLNATVATLSPIDLMARITANDLTAKCLQDTGSYCDRNARDVLAWNLYKVKNGVYDKNDGTPLDDLKQVVKNLKESAPAAPPPAQEAVKKPGRDRKAKPDLEARPKTTAVSGRAALVRLAERYVALADEVDALAGEAAKQVEACRTGEGCSEARSAVDALTARRDETDRIGKELLSQSGAYRQTLGTESGPEPESAARLASLVPEVAFRLSDRVIAVAMQQELSDLRRNDNHPMHKVIKSAYYTAR